MDDRRGPRKRVDRSIEVLTIILAIGFFAIPILWVTGNLEGSLFVFANGGFLVVGVMLLLLIRSR
jgi:hypothetical protein